MAKTQLASTAKPPGLSPSDALALPQLFLACAAWQWPWDQQAAPFHSHTQKPLCALKRSAGEAKGQREGCTPQPSAGLGGTPCTMLVLCKLAGEKQATLTPALALGLLIPPEMAWEKAAGTPGVLSSHCGHGILSGPCGREPRHGAAQLWGPQAGMGPLCCLLTMMSPRMVPPSCALPSPRATAPDPERKLMFPKRGQSDPSEKCVSAGSPTPPGK